MEVTGKRRNKGIGLEIPATYSFYHKKPLKVKTLRELIRDKEDKAEVRYIEVLFHTFYYNFGWDIGYRSLHRGLR